MCCGRRSAVTAEIGGEGGDGGLGAHEPEVAGSNSAPGCKQNRRSEALFRLEEGLAATRDQTRDRSGEIPVAHQLADMCRGSVVGSQPPRLCATGRAHVQAHFGRGCVRGGRTLSSARAGLTVSFVVPSVHAVSVGAASAFRLPGRGRGCLGGRGSGRWPVRRPTRQGHPFSGVLLGKPPERSPVMPDVIARLKAEGSDVRVHVGRVDASPRPPRRRRRRCAAGGSALDAHDRRRTGAQGLGCCNSARSTLLTMDRGVVQQRLADAGLPVPNATTVSDADQARAWAAGHPSR